MKRLCAAVTLTAALSLFVLLVSRDPASTATRSDVPRGDQAAPKTQPRQTTHPTSSSTGTSSMTTTEPTGTTTAGTDPTSDPTSTNTTTMTSSTSEMTTSPTTATTLVTTQPAPSTAPSSTDLPAPSATPSVSPAPDVLSMPPAMPWLLWPPQPRGPDITPDSPANQSTRQSPRGPAEPSDVETTTPPKSSAPQSVAPLRTALPTVSIRPTELQTAFTPDALPPTPSKSAELMSRAVLVIVGGSLAAAAAAMALIRRRPGRHRG